MAYKLKESPRLAGDRLVCCCQSDLKKATAKMQYVRTARFWMLWVCRENCKTVLYRIEPLSEEQMLIQRRAEAEAE